MGLSLLPFELEHLPPGGLVTGERYPLILLFVTLASSIARFIKI